MVLMLLIWGPHSEIKEMVIVPTLGTLELSDKV